MTVYRIYNHNLFKNLKYYLINVSEDSYKNPLKHGGQLALMNLCDECLISTENCRCNLVN